MSGMSNGAMMLVVGDDAIETAPIPVEDPAMLELMTLALVEERPMYPCAERAPGGMTVASEAKV